MSKEGSGSRLACAPPIWGGSPDSEALVLPQEAKPGLPALVQNRDPQPALYELGRTMSLRAASGARAGTKL